MAKRWVWLKCAAAADSDIIATAKNKVGLRMNEVSNSAMACLY